MKSLRLHLRLSALLAMTLLTVCASAQNTLKLNAVPARQSLFHPIHPRRLPNRVFVPNPSTTQSDVHDNPGGITVTYGPVDYPRILGSAAAGINKKGQMVGGFNILAGSGCTGGYLLKGNTFRQVNYPGPYASCVLGINDSGEMVGGYSADGWNTYHVFSLIGKVFTAIPDPPGAIPVVAPAGVDDAGDIIGQYVDSSGVSHGFVYSKGAFTTIDVPGASDTFLDATSPNGKILAGSYYGSDGNDHGFLLQNGVFTTVDYPGAVDTEILGVNDSGDYVGNWGNGTLVLDFLEYNGFFFKGGSYAPLNLPWAAVAVTWPSGLNDKDQIAGAYVDTNNVILGFYATVK